MARFPYPFTIRNVLPPLCMTLLLLAKTSAQTPEPNRDPMKARLVTNDIANFWRVFDKASLRDAADLLQREYIDVGSPGLRAFVQTRILNGGALASAVASHAKYYASIRENTLALDRKPEIKGAIQASFRRLKEIYPEAIFPDVYFVVGRMNSAGTIDGGQGLLIGVEMNARDGSTPIDELNSRERAVIGQIENLPHIVAHEVIHIEQRQANPLRGSGKETLLAQALAEGWCGLPRRNDLRRNNRPRVARLWRRTRTSPLDRVQRRDARRRPQPLALRRRQGEGPPRRHGVLRRFQDLRGVL